MTDVQTELELWRGRAGDCYHARDDVSEGELQARARFFGAILCCTSPGARASSILEVGCGNGSNLVALSRLTAARLIGVEPNAQARARAKCRLGDRAEIVDGSILALSPLSADLVVSSGVLIHIPPDGICRAIKLFLAAAKLGCIALEHGQSREVHMPTSLGYGVWARDYAVLLRQEGWSVAAGMIRNWSTALAHGETSFNSCTDNMYVVCTRENAAP